MTTNLHARAAKIAELDKKRTPGEWEVHWDHHCIVFPVSEDHPRRAAIADCAQSHGLGDAGKADLANAAAIAALPEAFALVAELDAALTRAEAKLTGIEPKEKP